jgi:hypothetical protein
VLLQRDVSISNSGIATMVNKKLRHHSSASWYGFIQNKCKEDIDKLRRNAETARRKSIHQLSAGDSPVPLKRQKLDTDVSSGPAQPHIQDEHEARKEGDDEREDFEVICQFFANGGGDDSDDERVWSNLKNHRHCKTNPDWSEFYREREEAINEHIKTLLRAAGGRLPEDGEVQQEPQVV